MVQTQPAKLIRNLDDLPAPAYDLMPMHLYGKSRYLFFRVEPPCTIQEYCTSKCSFVRGGQIRADRKVDADGNVTLSPRWRSKSVDRMMSEIELLYYKYGKRSMYGSMRAGTLIPNPTTNLRSE